MRYGSDLMFLKLIADALPNELWINLGNHYFEWGGRSTSPPHLSSKFAPLTSDHI
jgi:hypothetical protein